MIRTYTFMVIFFVSGMCWAEETVGNSINISSGPITDTSEEALLNSGNPAVELSTIPVISETRQNNLTLSDCFDVANPVHQKHPPICYQLTRPSRLRLTVYSEYGEQIRLLRNGFRPEGKDVIWWDRTNDYGEPVGPGRYVAILEINGIEMSTELLLTR